MTRPSTILVRSPPAPAPMLVHADALTLRHTDRELVRDLDLEVAEGDRVALVGRNGAGKSTLLRALTGATEAWADGRVRRAPGTWWAYVGQDESTLGLGHDATLFDLAGAALAPLRALGAEVAAAALALGPAPTAAALAAYGAAQSAFEARGGYDADRRLDEALRRVGLAAAGAHPAAQASGGERRRARLAGALAAGVDLLLLDEPTNHLDLEGRAWLAERLRAHRGAVVFAAHDRALIDEVATHLLVLDASPVRVHRGGWSDWQRDRAVTLRTDARATRLRQRRIAELEGMAAELRAQGHRTAQTRRRRAEREMAALRSAPPPSRSEVSPRLDLDARTEGGLIARFEHLTFGRVLEDVALVLTAGERLALVGANGSGKSTLLRLLAGEIESEDPLARVWWRPGTRVAYVDQHRRGLPDDASVRSVLTAWVTPTRAEGLLALVDLPRSTHDRAIATLSGGERARASAALLMAREADVLLLDEPTNDLDLRTIEALEAALRSTSAAVVLVTHDARTIEALAADVVTLEDGALTRWRGGLAGWRRGVRRREAGLPEPTPTPPTDRPAAPAPGVDGRAEPELPRDLDAARTEADVALDDPWAWSDRDRRRWRSRRRALEEALIADWERSAVPARPPFRTREGGWLVWAEPSDGGLRVWLDGADPDGHAALKVRVLTSEGRRVAHLVPTHCPDRDLAPWAWHALIAGAARLTFYVANVSAVQVASERSPGGGFGAWAPGWWWWRRRDLERAEGWRRTRGPRSRPRRLGDGR